MGRQRLWLQYVPWVRKEELFDLLSSEEGNADRGKALSAGAVLGGSALAQMLLAPAAHAVDPCNAWDAGACNVATKNACEQGLGGFVCTWDCYSPPQGGSLLTCYTQ